MLLWAWKIASVHSDTLYNLLIQPTIHESIVYADRELGSFSWIIFWIMNKRDWQMIQLDVNPIPQWFLEKIPSWIF